MVSKPMGIDADVRCMHPSNALGAILVVLLGNTTDDKFAHPIKDIVPIFDILQDGEKYTDVIPSFPAKAIGSISVMV
jgi:hypothetical protein